ncbi:MAG TPA: glycosyltransferase [Thermomicrobiaceae bacterium]|nr:glycosyltransferase [Thermomicrobiaceae bacterium]
MRPRTRPVPDARLPPAGRGRFLAVLVALQAVLGARVLLRLVRTAGGTRIDPAPPGAVPTGAVAVVVPVLDERDRLAPCLDGLVAQGPEVAEILVVDGGSTDGTPELVAAHAARDSRIRLIDASPVPAGWNGKPWGLQVGLETSRPTATWVLMVDADVRPAPALARSLAAHARRTRVPALSAATLQTVSGPAEALLHPSLLTTLVYRFGIPGRATRRVAAVQANGQCFLARRDLLVATGAIARARDSRCEDVTMARVLAADGHEVGFYEAGDLVTARMYATVGDAWRNWPRSLPMRDRYAGIGLPLGLAEVALVQALPLPLLAALLLARRRGPAVAINAVLACARLGVLVGTARAYRHRPWTYWLSPLGDLPVAARLCASALRRRHVWRGRVLVTGGRP